MTDIISPLPFTLQNGTLADATQVMANLNQIRDDVNSNAAGGGGAGNVVGPASAVDGHLAVFSGTTGKILRDGGAVPSGGGAKRATVDVGGTYTAGTHDLLFTSVLFDSGGIVSGNTFVAPAGAQWARLISNIDLVSGATGNRVISGYINGSYTPALSRAVPVSSEGYFCGVARPCSPGDIFSFKTGFAGTLYADSAMEMVFG